MILRSEVPRYAGGKPPAECRGLAPASSPAVRRIASDPVPLSQDGRRGSVLREASGGRAVHTPRQAHPPPSPRPPAITAGGPFIYLSSRRFTICHIPFSICRNWITEHQNTQDRITVTWTITFIRKPKKKSFNSALLQAGFYFMWVEELHRFVAVT